MKAPSFDGSLVVGIRFRASLEQVVAASVAPRDGLVLEREPNNAHDSCAVKVLHGSVHIGYVQRDVAAPLSRVMDKGIFYTATVVKNRRISIVVNIHPIKPPKKKKTALMDRPIEYDMRHFYVGVEGEDVGAQ